MDTNVRVSDEIEFLWDGYDYITIPEKATA